MTAPAVRPEIMYRCRNMKRIRIGSISMSTAAAIPGQLLPYKPWKTINPRVIGYKSALVR